MVKIRPFRNTDAIGASTMIHRNLEENLSTKYPRKTIEGWKKEFTSGWLKEISKNGTAFICADGKKVVGVAIMQYRRAKRQQKKRWWIRILFVEPKKHKQGIGEALVVRLERIAARRKAVELLANSSLGAAGFYEKIGFKRLKRMRVPNGGWIWRMRKRI